MAPKASCPRWDDEQISVLWNMDVDNCLLGGILAKLNSLNESSGDRNVDPTAQAGPCLVPRGKMWEAEA